MQSLTLLISNCNSTDIATLPLMPNIKLAVWNPNWYFITTALIYHLNSTALLTLSPFYTRHVLPLSWAIALLHHRNLLYFTITNQNTPLTYLAWPLFIQCSTTHTTPNQPFCILSACFSTTKINHTTWLPTLLSHSITSTPLRLSLNHLLTLPTQLALSPHSTINTPLSLSLAHFTTEFTPIQIIQTIFSAPYFFFA